MARKKQEIALQKELNSQEEWDDLMGKEGLFIVDIYQEWCGPCKSIVSLFRRLKNESGEDLLQFFVAKADTIDSLVRYRGNCKPCFLFYGSGTLVDVVRGVNPPELEKKIKKHLENELNVLKGEPGAERVEVKDPAFKDIDEAERKAKEKAEEEEEEEREREVTVVLIKPDAKDKVEEIKQQLQERGIEILEQQERQLTEEEARDFYRHLEDQEWFEQMISYMTKDVSTVLVIAKENEGIISEFREILGPANVEEAKEKQPSSLRAIFGTESFMNAIHAPESGEKAQRELHLFFPEFRVPTYKVAKPKKSEHKQIEKTVALIRPDAFNEFKDEILAKISEAGFAIALQKEVQLTRERAEEFYSDKKGSPFFEELINRMTNGPVLALALAKEDAVTEWRRRLGEKDPKEAKTTSPQSLRALYSKEDIEINLLHGSDSFENARKELEFFFPTQQTFIVIKPDAYENRNEIIQRITDSDFVIAARKDMELSEEMARELYKSHAEKEYFNDLISQLTSGKSVLLAVSRNDAVAGWRSMMGVTDPAQATDQHPQSIRAIYGKDIRNNAVHGSSNEEHAAESIRLIFGDIQFDEEGRRVPGTGDVPEPEEEEEAEADEEEKDGFVGPNGEIVRNDPQEAGEGEGDQHPAGDEAAEAAHGEAASPREQGEGASPEAQAAEAKEEGEAEGQEAGAPGEAKPEDQQGQQEADATQEEEAGSSPDEKDEKPEDAKQDGDKQEGEKQDDDKHEGEKQESDKPEGDKQEGDKPEGDKQEGDKQGDKQEGDKQEDDKQEGDKQEGDKLEGDKQEGDKQEGDKQEGDKQEDDKQEGDKQGDKQEGDKQEGDKQEGDKQEGDKQEGEKEDDKQGDKQEGDKQEGEKQEGGAAASS